MHPSRREYSREEAAERMGHWPTDGSLPARVEKYVDWVVAFDRQPPTKKEFAAENGVGFSTLYDWDKDDRVRKAIDQRATDYNMSPERIQGVINAVHRAAMAGDMNAAKLYLQHVDRLAPKRLVIEDDRIDKLTDEELQAELVELGLVGGDSIHE